MNAADEKAWREWCAENGKMPDGVMSIATKKKVFLAGRASRNSEVEGLREVLRRYEKFEANIIEHGDWSGDCVKFTQDLHDEMIEVQTLRNQALTKGDSDAG